MLRGCYRLAELEYFKHGGKRRELYAPRKRLSALLDIWSEDYIRDQLVTTHENIKVLLQFSEEMKVKEVNRGGKVYGDKGSSKCATSRDSLGRELLSGLGTL